MIETKEKTIGDAVYSVTQLPALRAIRLQSKLLKLVGPSFAAMIASADKEDADSCLPQAVSLLADKVQERTFEDLVLELMQGVRKDGEEMTRSKIDLEFAGNLNELYQVLQFVLEANFSDFFQEGGIIDLLKKRAETTPVSPALIKT